MTGGVIFLLLSPYVFGGVALAAWAAFDRRRWARWQSRAGWILPTLGMGLYTAGYLLSIAGDALYKGSGEPFDWGSHYALTIPMMVVGFFLPPIALLNVVLTEILFSLRKTKPIHEDAT